MKQFIQEKLRDNRGFIHGAKTGKEWFAKNGFEKQYEEIIEKTSFLKNPTMVQRIYHILNDMNSEPICPNCNEKVPEFETIIKGYRKYCSNKCQAESSKETRKRTILERYGEFPFCSKSSVEKRKKTCLEKYGTEFPFQNKEIQGKQTQTMSIMYGVENPSKLQEVKDKKTKTCLKNWGTENPNQCEEIHKRKKKTSFEKYGVEYFFQSDEFREMSKHFPGSNKSNAESEVLEFLKTIIDSEIEQGNKSILNGKELDILIKDKSIAIEYCGLYWHSNKFRNNTYHKEKFSQCDKQGIRLITLFEDEWLRNKDLVKIKLSHILNVNVTKKIYARKCFIKLIDYKEKSEFFNKYHIQGNGNSSVNIGLYFESELVSCMSFKKRKQGVFELDRYATKYNVVGGFGKLLSYFKSSYDWNEIITFADLRWHNGEVYKLFGFELDKIINPDYCYYINNKRSHKFNFRKKAIQKKFPDMYDDTLSESENMKNIGILKIYDCGKIRFKLTKEV
nr:MAG: hypothetical protein [Caudoviricetes sp.]